MYPGTFIFSVLRLHEVPLLSIYPGQLPHDVSITLAGLLYHCPVSLSTITPEWLLLPQAL